MEGQLNQSTTLSPPTFKLQINSLSTYVDFFPDNCPIPVSLGTTTPEKLQGKVGDQLCIDFPFLRNYTKLYSIIMQHLRGLTDKMFDAIIMF